MLTVPGGVGAIFCSALFWLILDSNKYLAHNLGLEEHGDTRSWAIRK